jgi:two-component system, chemotaxis family, CheB/CheR fusion protein
MAEETVSPSPDGLDGETHRTGLESEYVPVPTSQTVGVSAAPVVSDTRDEAEDGRPLPFNVVGIGASAGGIEAYIELLEHLPPKTDMAYVLVLHMAADQKSHLREILARHTPMPVEEIASGMRIEMNHVYVAPPRSLLRVEKGVFQFEAPNSAKRTIDYFFYSLATDQKNRAIGIILSGMDSDGALGMRAIKGEGGITMVQTPETAQHPDMPRSSIAVDHVDIVSPPSAIAAQLAQLSRQFRETSLRLLQDGAAADGEEHYLTRILSMMRNVSGVEFRLYKPTTIRRRIARRMLLHRIDTLRDYAAFLQANPVELRELHEDALINVTRFFRDPDVYEAFKSSALPHPRGPRFFSATKDLGGWLFHRRGGLLRRHLPFGIPDRKYQGATRSDFRNRRKRVKHSEGRSRGLFRNDSGRCLTGKATAVLR